MKPILKEKLKRLRDGADEAREHLAAQLFKLNDVVEAMARESAKGYRVLKITPPIPIDLAKTKAALELVNQIKEAGATAEWFPRQPSDTNAGEVFFDLVVKW